MPGWTTPTQRNTGDLITSSIWNTDIKDNLRYLKGMDGAITLEDNVLPSAATKTIGSGAYPYGAGHFYQAFAGPRLSLHKSVRELVINWEDDTLLNYQVTEEPSGGGTDDMGGSGQLVQKVDDDEAGSAYVGNQTEQNSAKDTSFNASRNPYLRVEFSINNSDVATEVFIGFRTTLGAARPLPAAESYAGLIWNGAVWLFVNGDGAGNLDSSGSQTVVAARRYVIEIFINGGSYVEYWKDGVLVKTSTTALPSGNLEWQSLIKSVGGGGAGDDSRLTIGKIIVQEDLS